MSRLAAGEPPLTGAVQEVLTAPHIERVWGITCPPVCAVKGASQFLFD